METSDHTADKILARIFARMGNKATPLISSKQSLIELITNLSGGEDVWSSDDEDSPNGKLILDILAKCLFIHRAYATADKVITTKDLKALVAFLLNTPASGIANLKYFDFISILETFLDFSSGFSSGSSVTTSSTENDEVLLTAKMQKVEECKRNIERKIESLFHEQPTEETIQVEMSQAVKELEDLKSEVASSHITFHIPFTSTGVNTTEWSGTGITVPASMFASGELDQVFAHLAAERKQHEKKMNIFSTAGEEEFELESLIKNLSLQQIDGDIDTQLMYATLRNSVDSFKEEAKKLDIGISAELNAEVDTNLRLAYTIKPVRLSGSMGTVIKQTQNPVQPKSSIYATEKQESSKQQQQNDEPHIFNSRLVASKLAYETCLADINERFNTAIDERLNAFNNKLHHYSAAKAKEAEKRNSQLLHMLREERILSQHRFQESFEVLLTSMIDASKNMGQHYLDVQDKAKTLILHSSLEAKDRDREKSRSIVTNSEQDSSSSYHQHQPHNHNHDHDHDVYKVNTKPKILRRAFVSSYLEHLHKESEILERNRAHSDFESMALDAVNKYNN